MSNGKTLKGYCDELNIYKLKSQTKQNQKNILYTIEAITIFVANVSVQPSPCEACACGWSGIRLNEEEVPWAPVGESCRSYPNLITGCQGSHSSVRKSSSLISSMYSWQVRFNSLTCFFFFFAALRNRLFLTALLAQFIY